MEWITALFGSLLILSSTSSSLLFELLSIGLTVFVSSVTFVWYFLVYSLLKFSVHTFFSWYGDHPYDRILNSSSCQSLFSVSLRSVCGVLFLLKHIFLFLHFPWHSVLWFPLHPSSWGCANICQCPSGKDLGQHSETGWLEAGSSGSSFQSMQIPHTWKHLSFKERNYSQMFSPFYRFSWERLSFEGTIVWYLNWWSLRPGRPSSNASSATCCLCVLGHMTQPLCVLISSYARQEWKSTCISEGCFED